jgi:hypothetical protein
MISVPTANRHRLLTERYAVRVRIGEVRGQGEAAEQPRARAAVERSHRLKCFPQHGNMRVTSMSRTQYGESRKQAEGGPGQEPRFTELPRQRRRSQERRAAHGRRHPRPRLCLAQGEPDLALPPPIVRRPRFQRAQYPLVVRRGLLIGTHHRRLLCSLDRVLDRLVDASLPRCPIHAARDRFGKVVRQHAGAALTVRSARGLQRRRDVPVQLQPLLHRKGREQHVTDQGVSEAVSASARSRYLHDDACALCLANQMQ